jgi:hypothetical protein
VGSIWTSFLKKKILLLLDFGGKKVIFAGIATRLKEKASRLMVENEIYKTCVEHVKEFFVVFEVDYVNLKCYCTGIR